MIDIVAGAAGSPLRSAARSWARYVRLNSLPAIPNVACDEAVRIAGVGCVRNSS